MTATPPHLNGEETDSICTDFALVRWHHHGARRRRGGDDGCRRGSWLWPLDDALAPVAAGRDGRADDDGCDCVFHGVPLIQHLQPVNGPSPNGVAVRWMTVRHALLRNHRHSPAVTHRTLREDHMRRT